MSRNKGLEKQNIQDIVSLTPLQEGMLLHYLQHPESTHYCEQLSLEVQGPLKPEMVQRAWDHVIATNEMLRTVFRWEKIAKPVQLILKTLKTPLRVFDLSAASESEIEEKVRAVQEADRMERIDIRVEPFRVTLIQRSDRSGVLIVTNHHILYDGWSNGIILKEFLHAYHALLAGQTLVIPQKKPFKEFVRWLQLRDRGAEQEYWKNYLAGFDTKTLLPVATRETRVTGTGREDLILDVKATAQLQQIAAAERITLATIFYAVWGILLQRYNNTTDVLFGTTVSGRNADLGEIEEMVGLFINTIPLRVKTSEHENILSFLHKLDHDLQKRTEFAHVPLVDIKSASAMDSQEALFDSIVIIENYPLDQQVADAANQLRIEEYSMLESADFDLTLAIEINDQIKVRWVYNTWKFAQEDIERLSGHFSNILTYMLQHLGATVGEIEILLEDEKTQLLTQFNDYPLAYPKEQTVYQLFEYWVEKTPDIIAIKYMDQQLTYRELNQRANQLAHFLLSKGLQLNQTVGIMAERSVELLVGIMGILKAGGAYVPINAHYPVERVRYMLEDSGAKFFLTQAKLLDQVEFLGGQTFALEDEAIYLSDDTNPGLVQDARTLAYVIYTSGSTGRPKGVMIAHQSLNNFLYNYYAGFDGRVGAEERCLSFANISFDASVSEIFIPLAFGATLVFFNNEVVPDVHKLADLIVAEGITLAFLPPTLLKPLYERLATKREKLKLNKVMTGIEPILDYVFADYMSLHPEMQILNGYGPTETTICATYYKYVPGTPIGRKMPIGRPLSNLQVLILDQSMRPVPVGVGGELCVGGDGLAMGYLGRPDLTAEKFVAYPGVPGGRVYRTGDRARWLPDGNIEFLGRLDYQVKIRGYRIEPGEIEHQLANHPAVRDVVVLPRVDSNGQGYLCAYLVVLQELTVTEMREYLAKSLPDYMIPSYFIQLEQLPVNANGKIDRKALPVPEGNVQLGTAYVAPRNHLEERLVSIWQEVLGVERVGIFDNFFALGGHSLKATGLAGRMHKEFDVEVPLNEIFKDPTINGLSEFLQRSVKQAYTEIVPVPGQEYYATSSAQKRMYMLQQFEPTSTRYNMPGVFEVHGLLDLAKVEQAFRELIQRHESFRTSFEMRGEKIVQKVQQEVAFALEFLDQVQDGKQEFVRPFDLRKTPLFRVGVIPKSEGKHVLLFDMHHIISDGTSMAVLTNEFVQLYAGQSLAPLRIQYKDFAEWQNQLLHSERFKQQEAYWLKRFADEVPVLNLPTDERRPATQSLEGATLRYQWSLELTGQVKRLSQDTGTTLYMVLLAGLNVLLSRYSGQSDIIIGSPIAGRPHPDLERVIGMFINTLAMRNQPEGQKTFVAFLHEVKEHALAAFENQDYPLEELVERLDLSRDLSRNPLFDVVFALQNMEQGRLQVEGVEFVPVSYEKGSAKFDLTIMASEGEDGLEFEIEYSSKLFKPTTITRMVEHLQNILQAVVHNPQLQLSEIDMLAAAEREQLLIQFNNTAVTYPENQTIQQLFEEQAEWNPAKTAVVFLDKSLSYGELNTRANRLARELREKGVREETIVGIMAERSLKMIVGIVAILKAGGAYLPIDPEYPEERIKLMLDDCSVPLLLIPEGASGMIPVSGWACEVLAIAGVSGDGNADAASGASAVTDAGVVSGAVFDAGVASGTDAASSADVASKVKVTNTTDDATNANPIVASTPESLAYVIYTSGSTGRPKGVMVEHRSIVRLVKNTDYVGFNPGEKILQTGTLAFDASTFEIWGALTNGLELHLAPKDLILRPEYMARYLQDQQISTIFLTTALFNLFAEERPEMFRTLTSVLTGGEIVSPRHIHKVRTTCPDLRLVHVYGPTENTTFSTSYLVGEQEPVIPIGKPIHNSTAWIIDSHSNLCPVGVYGELCVGGVGLARGYINNPELTAEKFVEHPILHGERMYRTGDLARWLADGNIDFLGRVDHQVKIRGFRIEPGEIENHLLQHPQVEEALVIDRTDAHGNKYLCAYLVLHVREERSSVDEAKSEEAPLDGRGADGEIGLEQAKSALTGELREFLQQKLPAYMIPAAFMPLEKMPLNRNGKIDRKALPEPEATAGRGTVYEAPCTALEVQLAAIWSEVLGIKRVGRHDNFFELGGHSLRATIVASRIHQALQIELPLREIFHRPTIKELAEYMATLDQNLYCAIRPVEERADYPASSAQVRIYLQNQFEGTGISYNIPWAFIVEGALDELKVEQAFQQIVARHEILRTSLEMVGGEVRQKVWRGVNFGLKRLASAEQALPDIIRDFVQPFDLKQAPLLRVGLAELDAKRYLLLLDLHHIIADGTSMGILVKEFVNLYQGEELTPLTLQYRDYSVWQNELFATGKLKAQEVYWLNRFAGSLPVLDLPTDYPRPAMQSFEGQSINFEIDAELTAKLNALAKEQGVTLYMILLAAYNLLLTKYTGQEDLVVGTPVAGRPHADLQGLIGMFVNTLALRNYPVKTMQFREFLRQVKETALEAYENQEYPFEQLASQLQLVRDTSRNPLFDTMFALQNMEQGELEIAGLRFIPYRFENPIAKFDLSLFAYEADGKIIVDLEYSTKLFAAGTVERLARYYLNVLRQITERADCTIAGIDLLTDAEKQQILTDLNATRREYPRDKTIHQLFVEQAARTPEKIALVFGEQTMTYRELDRRSNQLARTLRSRFAAGAKGTPVADRDRIVALLAERSMDMIIALLAILKAGAAYLPVDPEYPGERISYMLEDSGADLLLSEAQLAQTLLSLGDTAGTGFRFAGEMIDILSPDSYEVDDSPLEFVNTADDLLYLIYTSGSTGKPKGAMLEHRNMVNLLSFQYACTNIDFQTKVLQFTTISFDVSYQEIFSTLLAGGQLYLIDNETRKTPTKLLEYIGKQEIEVIFLPTSYFKFIVGDAEYLNRFPQRLRHIIVAGEQLVVRKQVGEYLRRSGVYLHNHYGPSEAHVVSTYTLDPNAEIPQLPPIGKPISNTRLYIGTLDTETGSIQLVPERVVGELFIAGDCVGRGYHARPELTAARFLTDPFVAGDRLYRTGDLARWLPDGNIEFIGRIDHQVKIRGYRVEIGEIESCLVKQEGIKEAIVLVKGEESNQYLCAYLVPDEGVSGRQAEVGEVLNLAELRSTLQKELPDYMIPAYFIELKALPLTPNGKVDRRALPEPEGSIVTGVEYVAPSNAVEAALVAIWKDVLKVEEIGVRHNFFELGGHSLKATILISRIHQQLNVEVSLRELFQRPTIQELAAYIAQMETTQHSAIQRIEERAYYPASFAQKRLYLQAQLEGAGVSYNMPGALWVEGNLSRATVERVFQQLIERHATLRTSFDLMDGEVVQRIAPEVAFALQFMQGTEEQLPQMVSAFVRPFELGEAPLLRVGLVQVMADKHLLIFDMHHIISDGTSMGVLVKEFVQLYEGRELPELPVQYKDFAVWQQGLFASGQMEEQAECWLERFAGEIPVLTLPTDLPRPTLQSFEGQSVEFTICRELTQKLNALSKETDTTLYMVLLGCYNLLLAKYSGQEDIVVGSPVAGRSHADLHSLIGMFVNTLAIRNHLSSQKTYCEFLQDVKENALKAYENQDYPLEELVERLQVRRDLSRNPLFDVVFVMQNMDQGELKVNELSFRPYKFSNTTAKFDLTLSVSEVDGGLACVLEYSSRLFLPATIERMIAHLRNICAVVTANPAIQLGTLDMLSTDEKNQLLYEFNDTVVEYPRDKTLQQLFAEQVALTPDRIAVVARDTRLTYRELDARAEQFAHLLRSKGVGRDTIVGIITERSVEMLTGLLAIIKAGGAYLPLDPDYPEDRIRLMLEDCAVQVILTQGAWKSPVAYAGDMIDLTREIRVLAQTPKVLEEAAPTSLAYVIYTSGSTGRPKGVMVEQRGVVRLVKNPTYIEFSAEDKILQTGTLAFDASTFEIWGALLNGLELHLGEKDLILSSERMERYMVENQISILWLTAPLFNLLADDRPGMFKMVKYLLVGGDVLSPRHVNLVRRECPDVQIVNGYGPTENTTFSTYFHLDQEYTSNIPIGRPVSNSTAYIVDCANQLTPVGVYGELCVGGDGLARGYLNNSLLTAEKFVPNPWVPGARMYRTGDLVRWLPDGLLDFQGRIDQQVKIRGFRIELGEIENRLLEHERVKEAVVIDRIDEKGNKYLCAYFVALPEDEEHLADDAFCSDGEEVIRTEEFNVKELREYLAQSLPDYMLPTHFVQLARIPLTPVGKVNRPALPEPDGVNMVGSAYEPPRTEVEVQLAAIWAEVLGVERVGIQDHFFELGGHSLKATVLVSRIHKEMHVELALRDFFQRPTVKALAELIEGAEESRAAAIKPVAEREYYPASSAQKRLYIQNQFEGIGVSYNMPGAVRIEGMLDRERFAQVFATLVRRHETLRTSFALIDGEVVQKVLNEVVFNVSYWESAGGLSEIGAGGEIGVNVRNGEVSRSGWSDCPVGEGCAYSETGLTKKAFAPGVGVEQEVRQLLNDFVQPFDLSEAPLMRVGLVRLAADQHIMVFDLHHSIADGVSVENLIREFVALYQGQHLPELKIQYRDFAVWQNDLFKNGVMAQQEQYWLETLGGELPTLNLPTDFPRPPVQSYQGERLDYTLDRELMLQLKKLAAEQGATLYMALMAAYNILLYKYTGQEDLIVGSPVAGRRHADLEPLIGMFVNMLALRNAPGGSKTFSQFLAEVKENTLSAFDNQEYQFEEILEKLHVQRNLSHNPLFDVVFSLQDATRRSLLQTDGLRFVPYNLESSVAKYDLTLEVIEEAEQMLVSIEYCTALFRRRTVERLGSHFSNLLRAIVQNPEGQIQTLGMLSEAEQWQILHGFNATGMAYAEDQTLHELFTATAESRPEQIALVEGEETLTYGALNSEANRLAHRLRELGVTRDAIVAIMAERSLAMLVGILGVLKAGGAYMPVDPGYPVERIEFMLADSGAGVLLTHSQHSSHIVQNRSAENAAEIEYRGIVLDLEERKRGDADSPANLNSPGDLAYVMYTSGSTGKPKGVMIEHRGVVSLSQYYNTLFGLDQQKRILHMSNVSFDTSVVEIFPPLIYGSTVYIIGKELALDRLRFLQYVQENQINLAQFVPMTLQEILGESERPACLESVIVGGDKLDDSLKDRILSLGYRLTNHYGPTESTVDAIVAVCEPGRSTIGKPVANMRVYILDRDGNLTPVGVPGELCIAGVGLARGYLKRPELTAERFVPNPWVPGETIYHTGDLACWQEDGNITFLGRIDNQVKIRGYRIELGEIEERLLQHPAIHAAVVIDRLDAGGNRFLCGYVVRHDRVIQAAEVADSTGDGTGSGELNLLGLKDFLAKELPDYMIPSHFMELERIPVTHNGKVDRRALPEMEGVIATSVEYVAPETALEEKLIAVWQEVLGVEEIGLMHNFFEIGGHSLKAVQIVNRVHKECHCQISLQDIFAAPTIKGLAERMQRKGISEFTAIQRLPEQEYYALSYNQKRLWIASQLEPESIAYNLPGRITVEGPADEALVQRILQELIRRHESLRTQFKVVQGEPVQIIGPDDSIELQVFDLSQLATEERLAEQDAIFTRLAYEPFHLIESPLLRVAFLKCSENQFEMIFSMHHIISDGWSLEILKGEFERLYAANREGRVIELPPLAVQYRDFAAWQNELIADPAQNQLAREYWLNKFRHGFPLLNLPQDYHTEQHDNRQGAAYRVVIPAELKDQLKALTSSKNTSLFIAMATALKMFLADLTGQEEIGIGVPSSGRQHQNLNNVIGFFINTIVLINRVSPGATFEQMLELIHQDTMQALAYQDYPLELVTEELQMKYPAIQVFFNMLNMGQSDQEVLTNLEPWHLEKVQDVKFDLMFYLTEYANGIELICTYMAGLFKPVTIEYLVNEYVRFIAKMLGAVETEVDEDDDFCIGIGFGAD